MSLPVNRCPKKIIPTAPSVNSRASILRYRRLPKSQAKKWDHKTITMGQCANVRCAGPFLILWMPNTSGMSNRRFWTTLIFLRVVRLLPEADLLRLPSKNTKQPSKFSNSVPSRRGRFRVYEIDQIQCNLSLLCTIVPVRVSTAKKHWVFFNFLAPLEKRLSNSGELKKP